MENNHPAKSKYNFEDSSSIDELIKDMREALQVEDKIKKVHSFLDLLPDSEVIELMGKTSKLTKEQSTSFLEIITSIKKDLEEYEYYLTIENEKIKKLSVYLN